MEKTQLMTAWDKSDLNDHPATLKQRQLSRAAVRKLNHEPVLSPAVFPVSSTAWSWYVLCTEAGSH